MPPDRTEQISADSVPPIDQESSKKEWEEWPVVKLAISGAGHPYIPALSMRCVRETYHPESAPNVLSPEEAQLLCDIAAEKYHHGDPEYERFDEILDRLSTYAKDQS